MKDKIDIIIFFNMVFFIDSCASVPCQNGASCRSYLNYYNCTCLPNYVGTNCEVKIEPCRSFPCQNGGTCEDLQNGKYRCLCATSFSGTNCQIAANFCQSNPCFNGATCLSSSAGYTCTCLPGFTGVR